MLKKIISVLLCTICVLFSLTTMVYAEPTIYVDPRTDPEVITSKDGKYGYYLNDDEASIVISYEDDITVFEFPDSVDGYPVKELREVYFTSNNVIRIIANDEAEVLSNIRYLPIDYDSIPENKQSGARGFPVCTLDLNDNLNEIKYIGYTDRISLSSVELVKEYSVSLKVLIIPESVRKIGNSYSYEFENIIFNSDIELSETNFSRADFEEWQNLIEIPFETFNAYYSGNALNTNAYAFGFWPYDPPPDTEYITPAEHPVISSMMIYRKPGAEGFEKLEEVGYTVKEYTDEWWNDIKEIESVTLSGTGLTENAEVTQKLSESELKWMDKEYSLNMKSGEKVKLSGTFAPSDAFDNRMFFVSLDEDVVKVDVDSGEVTALKKGTATVRCVAASGVFSDVIVSVDGGGMSEKASTTDTTNTNTSTKLISSLAKDNAPTKDKTLTVKPVYIIIPACAAIIAAAAIVVVKRKKK